jgi:hypothetical protein
VKLFVYCPEQYNGKEGFPEWESALQLSKKTKLPIVSNIDRFQELKTPQVVSVPEKSFHDIDRTVKLGFVQKIDITNEFYDIDDSVAAYFTDSTGYAYECKPTIRETHKIRFRVRHHKEGVHTVVVRDKNTIYLESSFTIT